MSDLDDGLMTDNDSGSSGALRPTAHSPLDAVVASAVQGFDAGAMVEGVVAAEVSKEVRKIVAAALTKTLTPERRQLLADTAAAAVEAEFQTMTGETDSTAAGDEPEVENHFPNVYVFVQDFLVKVQARPVRDGLALHWCSQWWDHPEAVSRLEALWKAFEVLRRDPGTGAATWWRDYADPTMAALSDAAGTFAKCSDTTHAVPPDLPVEPPAAWLLQSDGSTLSD